MGFNYENEKFGKRNYVEQFFPLLKSRTRRSYNRFPENKIKFRSTLSWMKSFALSYNLINCIKIYHLDSLHLLELQNRVKL